MPTRLETHILRSLDPAFSYLVFEKVKQDRGDEDFPEVFEKLTYLGIEIIDHEIYEGKPSDTICLTVKLRHKDMTADTKETLASLLPRNITYAFYGAMGED